MNERIQKLAKEANCSIDGMGYGEGNLEKFAELIVKECCEVVRYIDAVEIKKHFGVK